MTPQSGSGGNGSPSSDLGSRKADHIKICADRNLSIEGGVSGFQHLRFLHRSLPEIDFADVDTSTEFLGYRLNSPLLISCMTGGSDEGYRLNKILAEAANRRRIAVGTGSLRILLRKPEVTDHFHLKDIAPDVPVIANIGAVQLPELFASGASEWKRFRSILTELKMDALAVHLNAGQEIFQYDGDTNFTGLLEAIRRLAGEAELPIIVKETGAGIGPGESAALLQAGAAFVDVAGSGGTNWMSVEEYRDPDPHPSLDFRDWGIPSALATAAAVHAANVVGKAGQIIASGGLRHPLDFAKAISLGARLAGTALPFIRLAREGGLDACLSYIDNLSGDLKKAMFLTGSRTLSEFGDSRLLASPAFRQDLEDLIQAQPISTAVAANSETVANNVTSIVIRSISDNKFRKADIHQRRDFLFSDDELSPEMETATGHQDDLLDLADIMIESAVGLLPIPLGIARNFVINGKTYHVPMATEEPSVIAAASFAAGIIGRNGGFTAQAPEPLTSSYVYLEPVSEVTAGDITRGLEAVAERQATIESSLEDLLANMKRRGGGLKSINAEWLDEARVFRIELCIDVRDAMGANLVNSAAERISPILEEILHAKKLMAILSNRSEARITRASFKLPFTALARGSFSGEEMAHRIVRLTEIANADRNRAVTHNKGIMNGITATVLATTNDTRAVEAAAHAWASESGAYRSLTAYRLTGDGIEGSIEVPLTLGTVGGAVSFHPTARFALNILGNPNSTELSSIAACVGLAQNFAAISALAGEGIQQGHMKLHASRLAYAAGARRSEIPRVIAELQASGQYNSETAEQLLRDLRSGGAEA